MFPYSDIRFSYALSGGSLMDIGSYMILALRQIFSAEPLSCLSATPTLMQPPYDQEVDRAMSAAWRFPNGGVGCVNADLKAKGYPGRWWNKLVSWVPTLDWPGKVVAVHRETVVSDNTIGRGKIMWS
jgi:predicted dehydrogenase